MTYLDHNATTPMRPEVIDAMAASMREHFGNPNSTHSAGAAARYSLEKARRRIAKLIGAASPDEITFTGGGTEAINLALRGLAPNGGIAASKAEHKAVLDTARDLGGVHVLPVDEHARVRSLDSAQGATVFAVMLANNEVGSLNDIPALAAQKGSALLFVDGIQALGRVPIDVRKLGADAMAFSGHKLYGPKGVGVLWLRTGTRLRPLLTGGGQEHGLRGGTENVAGAVGFATALELSLADLAQEAPRLEALRELLWQELSARIPNIARNSPREGCLPGTLNVSIPGHASQRLVSRLDALGFCLSAGSACTSTCTVHSHVLQAMSLPEPRAASALRISLGRANTQADVLAFAEALQKETAE